MGKYTIKKSTRVPNTLMKEVRYTASSLQENTGVPSYTYQLFRGKGHEWIILGTELPDEIAVGDNLLPLP